MLRIPLPEYANGTLALLGKCALAQSAKALQMRPRSQSAGNKGGQITAGGERSVTPGYQGTR